MRIDIITCLPELLESPFGHSIIKRAITKKQLTLHIHNLRDYATNKHKKVDDYAYGGEAGMVLSIEPIAHCIEKLTAMHSYQEIIYMTPDGEPLTQKMANYFSLQDNFIVLCGHYKGVDERVRQHFITRCISIGDYVLSGGELPAAVLVDSIARLLPGVLSDETSALSDSFQDDLIAPPIYTRPYNFRGSCVPDILLSGNHKSIEIWKTKKAMERTLLLRPHLYHNATHE